MVKYDTFKEVQEGINNWIHSHGGYWSPLSMLCAIMEELGEVSRQINCLEGNKPKKPDNSDSSLNEELGDLIFSIICVANYYKIDLGEELNNSIRKYSKRDSNRFL
jgi:NTP pyrophosphatase (non-canonical NTP hydrolase)